MRPSRTWPRPISEAAARLLTASVLFLCSAVPSAAEFDASLFTRHDAGSTQRVDYEPWARFLAAHLRADADGVHRIDYGAVTDLEKKRLGAFLESLQAVDVAGLSRHEQLAFWINLYNVATVKVVLDHYPVASIRDIVLPPAGDGEGPWDGPLLRVLGRELSLNDVEHRILRPLWSDPRIHFAVNCASVGCPNLAAIPYTGRQVGGLLDRAAQAFVNHRRAVRFEGKRLLLSSLFDWYGSDFGSDQAEILEYLAGYARPPLRQRLQAFDGEIEFAYSWDLNGF